MYLCVHTHMGESKYGIMLTIGESRLRVLGCSLYCYLNVSEGLANFKMKRKR